ncbi:MAG: AAA family ATPase [Deltaproteobacteria bacterium]|nr:AAA family ATPase [Deltaproteobacteria bacterium]
MRLYVEPKYRAAESALKRVQRDPGGFAKVLLVGPRGGGKSTELRRISQLAKDDAIVVEIDLDASGVSAASVSAFDLLYVTSAALLRHTAEGTAETLFKELAEAYAGKEAKKTLGPLAETLAGIATFATAATAVAAGSGLLAGAAPLIGAASATTAGALRLLARPTGVIAETSPQGSALMRVSTKITREVRSQSDKPILVLLDGLEKMNGEAAERFRQMFVQTRLLADPTWSAVIAAPPCTLTETASALAFVPVTVWGFGPDDGARVVRALQLRLQAAGLDIPRDVETGVLEYIAQMSGGVPNHAIKLMQEAVAAAEGKPRMGLSMAQEAVRWLAQQLAQGLTGEDLDALAAVDEEHHLRGDRASALFADGRVIAQPPSDESDAPEFVVHPVLQRTVKVHGTRRAARDVPETEPAEE